MNISQDSLEELQFLGAVAHRFDGNNSRVARLVYGRVIHAYIRVVGVIRSIGVYVQCKTRSSSLDFHAVVEWAGGEGRDGLSVGGGR